MPETRRALFTSATATEEFFPLFSASGNPRYSLRNGKTRWWYPAGLLCGKWEVKQTCYAWSILSSASQREVNARIHSTLRHASTCVEPLALTSPLWRNTNFTSLDLLSVHQHWWKKTPHPVEREWEEYKKTFWVVKSVRRFINNGLNTWYQVSNFLSVWDLCWYVHFLLGKSWRKCLLLSSIILL